MPKTFMLLLVLMLGAWLRFDVLTQELRFHPDEALFATFARNAAVYGDWMLSGALDKPPLSVYASALSMQFTGVIVNPAGVLDLPLRVGEFSARLPSVFAGIVLVALVFRLAHVVTRSFRAALVSALLVALPPFMVGYNASAFTDSLMLVFMVAALLSAVEGKSLKSGLFLALSIASKQQGVYYLPLIAVLLLLAPHPRRSITRFALAFALGVGLLFLWDSARPDESLFALASVNNTPSALFSSPDALLPRLRVWLGVLGTVWGHGVVSAVVFALAFLTLVTSLRPHPLQKSRMLMDFTVPSPNGEGKPNLFGRGEVRKSDENSMFFQWGFSIYILLYFLAHWIIPFNQYDRYMLPLIPLVAILAGVIFQRINRQRQSRRAFYAAFIALTVILLAFQSSSPYDNRRRDSALIELTTWLNARSLGAIVYDHWLNWDLGYYMGAWSDKRRVYFPTPELLAESSAQNPEPAPRYFVFPDFSPDSPLWSASQPDTPPPEVWLEALRSVGFTVSSAPVFELGGFTVYEVSIR